MPDMPVEKSGVPPYDPVMEARVARLESDMRDVKAVLARIEPMIIRMDATMSAILPQLATKAEMSDLRLETRTEIAGLRVELAAKPSKTYMWGILGVLITAYAAGLAVIAVMQH